MGPEGKKAYKTQGTEYGFVVCLFSLLKFVLPLCASGGLMLSLLVPAGMGLGVV